MMLIRTRRFNLSRRGAFLVLFGGVFVLLGWSYLNIPQQFHAQLHHSLRFALSVAPIEVYGWGWIVCGICALAGGLVHRLDVVGFTAAIVMPVIWSLANFAAQVQDNTPRAWVSGALFGLIAAAIAVVAGMPDTAVHRDRRDRR